MAREPDDDGRHGPYRWASARNLREYYADYLFTDEGDDPWREVYHAALSGKVRVMLNGRIMTPEEVQAIDAKNWMPDDPGYPYALPGDILLSVPDALRFWMDRPRAGAMLKKFGG